MCNLCNYSCRNAEAKSAHLHSKKHFVEFLKYYLWQHEEKLVRDKRNVTLSCLEIEDSVPNICFRVQQDKELRLTLRVELSEESPLGVVLQACILLHPIAIFSLEDPQGVCTHNEEVACLAVSPSFPACSLNQPSRTQLYEIKWNEKWHDHKIGQEGQDAWEAAPCLSCLDF